MKSLLVFAVATTVLFFASCNDASYPEESQEPAKKPEPARDYLIKKVDSGGTRLDSIKLVKFVKR